MAEATQTITGLLKQIQAVVGIDHATDDPIKCDLATSDVFERSERMPAVMVVRPRSTSETSAVIRLLCENRVPAIARGAGLSYTGSFATERPAVVLDTLRMNDIEVNATDRYATVGAGASWADVAAALKPHAMTPTQISPISGLSCRGTVGNVAGLKSAQYSRDFVDPFMVDRK